MSTRIKALDSKVNVGMFLKAMGGRLKQLLASTMTAEEKLAAIIEQLEIQVQEKRKLAREIGAQMRAIADPETQELESLEAFKVRRAKLVQLGGTLVDKPAKKAQLGQVSQEVNALDAQIVAQQGTYDTLVESYELARTNYQQALAALETVRSNGPAMLSAIKAHKQALAARDKARRQDEVDTSFLDQLQAELSGVQAEMRTDQQIDKDLDAGKDFSVDAALAKMDAATVDDSLMAEFKVAAAE